MTDGDRKEKRVKNNCFSPALALIFKKCPRQCALSRLLCAAVEIVLDLCRRDFRRARQIDHLAVGLQKIKLAGPVIAHDKGVDMVLLNIRDFLFPVFLRYDQIDIADGFYQLLALFIAEVAFLFLLVPVEFIC